MIYLSNWETKSNGCSNTFPIHYEPDTWNIVIFFLLAIRGNGGNENASDKRHTKAF